MSGASWGPPALFVLAHCARSRVHWPLASWLAGTRPAAAACIVGSRAGGRPAGVDEDGAPMRAGLRCASALINCLARKVGGIFTGRLSRAAAAPPLDYATRGRHLASRAPLGHPNGVMRHHRGQTTGRRTDGRASDLRARVAGAVALGADQTRDRRRRQASELGPCRPTNWASSCQD
jgi:hypothetical protein